MKLNSVFHFLGILIVTLAACQKTTTNETVVFEINFEDGDLTNTNGVTIAEYNGNRVAGFYNNAKVEVSGNGLPRHDFVKVEFDLYVHDTWDGNNMGNETVGVGPDIWGMKVDGGTIIRTTFSNTVCNEVYCLLQSFPSNYPDQNAPGTASAGELPGRCASNGITRVYRIKRLVKHSRPTILLTFYDELKQTHVSDPWCDESWSIDNIRVSTLSAE